MEHVFIPAGEYAGLYVPVITTQYLDIATNDEIVEYLHRDKAKYVAACLADPSEYATRLRYISNEGYYVLLYTRSPRALPRGYVDFQAYYAEKDTGEKPVGYSECILGSDDPAPSAYLRHMYATKLFVAEGWALAKRDPRIRVY